VEGAREKMIARSKENEIVGRDGYKLINFVMIISAVVICIPIIEFLPA